MKTNKKILIVDDDVDVITVAQTILTKDGMFSIEVVACIGACGLAPVICINGNFHAKVTNQSIVGIIDNYGNLSE